MTVILHLNASARQTGSASRRLSKKVVEGLMAKHPTAKCIERDVLTDASFINADWIEASFTPTPDRNDELKSRLKVSDTLAQEMIKADHIVIGSPLYNFAVPAALKAWIDHICRPGLTFKPTDDGFEGLLTGKTVYLAMVSGSTDIEGPMDFATGYLKHSLGFLGIEDVRVVSASNLMIADADVIMASAIDNIQNIL